MHVGDNTPRVNTTLVYVYVLLVFSIYIYIYMRREKSRWISVSRFNPLSAIAQTRARKVRYIHVYIPSYTHSISNTSRNPLLDRRMPNHKVRADSSPLISSFVRLWPYVYVVWSIIVVLLVSRIRFKKKKIFILLKPKLLFDLSIVKYYVSRN